mgnify:CR=1 FL=1
MLGSGSVTDPGWDWPDPTYEKTLIWIRSRENNRSRQKDSFSWRRIRYFLCPGPNPTSRKTGSRYDPLEENRIRTPYLLLWSPLIALNSSAFVWRGERIVCWQLYYGYSKIPLVLGYNIWSFLNPKPKWQMNTKLQLKSGISNFYRTWRYDKKGVFKTD